MSATEPRVVRGLGELRGLVGETLGTSRPVYVSAARIQQFCLAVDNEEWIHWDEPRTQAAGLGGLIAPGLFLPSLFPHQLGDLVQFEDIPRKLFAGVDRLRLFSPVRAGDSVTAVIKLDSVEERGDGIAARYAVRWRRSAPAEDVGVAVMLVRYMA